ncbi:MAG: DUF1659 domain-containing protein [Desulfitobacteriaceae bacterium]
MAVVAIPLGSTLVVVYQTGLTTQGSPITRQKSLSDVKFDAAEQAVFDAAHALFGLAQYPVIDVLYRKNLELVDE